MATARLRNQWDHTASLMAVLCEINRDPKRRPRAFTPGEFHPMERPPRKEAPVPAPITALRDAFVPGSAP